MLYYNNSIINVRKELMLMSRKKRKLERQRKQNSPEKKAKQAKKAYYASCEAKDRWEEKKERKRQNQINARISKGVSVDCPLESWEAPSIQRCEACDIIKCSFNISEY